MIILDRFEGEYAVIEVEGKMVNVEKSKVDKEVKDGDLLELIDGIYYKNEEATNNRKRSIEEKFKGMWED